jgi:biofilm PGA synthesis N-glycosyltransferase PgaC
VTHRLTYAVVTPACNEATGLERLAWSLAEQTRRPAAWVVVENGSTDDTAAVAERLARAHAWVRALSIPAHERLVRGGPVVRAFAAGVATLEPVPDIVVKLDADVTLGAEYFAQLLDRFARDPRLGMASGTCYEYDHGAWRPRYVTGSTVWGAARAYRRECLAAVSPLEERMGWDGIDEFKANVLGWCTGTFADLEFRHHRVEGERDGTQRRSRAAQGRAAHYMGARPLYVTMRALFHARRDPAGMALLEGYLRAALSREPRHPDPAVRAYVRRQQSLLRLPSRIREATGRGRSPVSSNAASRS